MRNVVPLAKFQNVTRDSGGDWSGETYLSPICLFVTAWIIPIGTTYTRAWSVWVTCCRKNSGTNLQRSRAITSAQIVIPVGHNWMQMQAKINVTTERDQSASESVAQCATRRQTEYTRIVPIGNYIKASHQRVDEDRSIVTYLVDTETWDGHGYPAVPASNDQTVGEWVYKNGW